ncbi:hypothetical protein A4D02_21525 [Niastella koreensis]|uniref:Uncharacterized protein n=2 Tax=Niastella koreensis TaxID=354356 RepID=G8THX9_NIAKG|nr:hypothetical protein Niako_2219 [Niastella koreensis GR20-10]OQP52985.1 hypothetical protein A4D02_21525 [Niastella koreensis]
MIKAFNRNTTIEDLVKSRIILTGIGVTFFQLIIIWNKMLWMVYIYSSPSHAANAQNREPGNW